MNQVVPEEGSSASPRLADPSAPEQIEQNTKRPWARRPTESARAYQRFLQYLSEPGEIRVSDLGRSAQKLSYNHEWQARKTAYMQWQWESKIAERDLTRDKARQRIVDKLDDLITSLLDLTIGKMPKGDTEPIYSKGESGRKKIGDRAIVPPRVRLAAIDRALNTAGLTIPKRIELSGPGGEEIRIQARTALSDLSPDDLSRLAEALKIS